MKRGISLFLMFILIWSAGCATRFLRATVTPRLTHAVTSNNSSHVYSLTYETKAAVMRTEEFRRTATIIDQLNEQVVFKPSEVIILKDYAYYGSVDEIIPGCKCYVLKLGKERLLKEDSYVLSLLFHEYAHLKFNADIGIQQQAGCFFKEMTWSEKSYFTERDFMPRSGGHPCDGATELFASAYNLYALEVMGVKFTKNVDPTSPISKEFWAWIRTMGPFIAKVEK
jgi:hypothetical protein